MDSWRSLPAQVLLVLLRAPVVLKPIDQHLEWLVVRIVEVEAARSNLNELLQDLLFWNIAKNDVLRVGCQDSEAVRNSTWLLTLFFFQPSFKIFKGLSIREFLMTNNFANQSVARDDVALYNLSQALKIVIIADDESATNRSTLHLILFEDVAVNVMTLPELPSERDPVFASSRRSEEEITSL